MNQFPFMALYWNDLMSDNKVRVMANEELGAYVRLLGVAWHEDTPGTLPDAEGDLARYAGLDAGSWAETAPRVLACFTHDTVRNRYVQKCMVAEYKKLCERSSKRRLAGAKGNASRWKSNGNVSSQCDRFANRKSLASASLSESKNKLRSKAVELNGQSSDEQSRHRAPEPRFG